MKTRIYDHSLTRAWTSYVPSLERNCSSNQTVMEAPGTTFEEARQQFLTAHPEIPLDERGYHKAPNGDTYVITELHNSGRNRQEMP